MAKLAKERATCAVEAENESVQYNGYNLIGVTTVERGDGNYDSTSLFLYIRQLLLLGLYTVHNKHDGAAVRRFSNAKPVSTILPLHTVLPQKSGKCPRELRMEPPGVEVSR